MNCNINVLINIRILIIIIIILLLLSVLTTTRKGKSVFIQSVSWAKKRDMESQDELYSFSAIDLEVGGGGSY